MSVYREPVPTNPDGGADMLTPHTPEEKDKKRQRQRRRMGIVGTSLAVLGIAGGAFLGLNRGTEAKHADSQVSTSSSAPTTYEIKHETAETVPAEPTYRNRRGEVLTASDVGLMGDLYVDPNETLENAGKRFFNAVQELATIQGEPGAAEGTEEEGGALVYNTLKGMFAQTKPTTQKQIHNVEFINEVLKSRSDAKQKGLSPFAITNFKMDGPGTIKNSDSTVFHIEYKLVDGQPRTAVATLDKKKDPATNKDVWVANGFKSAKLEK